MIGNNSVRRERTTGCDSEVAADGELDRTQDESEAV